MLERMLFCFDFHLAIDSLFWPIHLCDYSDFVSIFDIIYRLCDTYELLIFNDTISGETWNVRDLYQK
jgi:uncharacterized membrane protein YwaF